MKQTRELHAVIEAKKTHIEQLTKDLKTKGLQSKQNNENIIKELNAEITKMEISMEKMKLKMNKKKGNSCMKFELHLIEIVVLFIFAIYIGIYYGYDSICCLVISKF